MVFIDDKNLINKSGTKTIFCQIMALKFVSIYCTCASPVNNLQNIKWYNSLKKPMSIKKKYNSYNVLVTSL